MPPLPIPGIVRVTTLKILGVTLTNGLSASNHIREIITNCAQTLTLCEFCDVMVCQVTPYKQSTETRLSLSCSTHAAHGAQASKRCGFCPPDLPPFNELIEVQEDQLFSTVIHNPQHLLHYLLPPPSAASQSYDLRAQQISTRWCWTSRRFELYIANYI